MLSRKTITLVSTSSHRLAALRNISVTSPNQKMMVKFETRSSPTVGGSGNFALEDIPKGTLVWKFDQENCLKLNADNINQERIYLSSQNHLYTITCMFLTTAGNQKSLCAVSHCLLMLYTVSWCFTLFLGVSHSLTLCPCVSHSFTYFLFDTVILEKALTVGLTWWT